MTRKFNVIYKSCRKKSDTSGEWEDFITECEIPWEEGIYDEKISYEDNLAYIVQCLSDDGFVQISPSEYINVNRIISFVSNKDANSTQSFSKNENHKTFVGKQRYSKGHNRNIRRFKGNKSHNQAPVKPTPPPNIVMKESEDLSQAKPQENETNNE